VIDIFPYYGPLLRLLPPEVAHEITVWALARGLAPRSTLPRDPALVCHAFGKELANPFGMAAGFDKNAEAVEGLIRVGFGFVEVGTVTPRPQEGNPRPRSFRLPAERAVINRMGFNNEGNRMGFNNEGLEAITGRLGRLRANASPDIVIGVNLGKNRDTMDAPRDYVAGIRAAAPVADFLVINVSSPNTPGLRDLQSRDALRALLVEALAARGRTERRPPLFVKIAPDLTKGDREDIAQVCLETGVDGLVVSNTTVARPAGLRGRHRLETGGLSGAPLRGASTELLREMYRLTQGKLTFIGVGGVASGADAYAKIRAGASLVQLYTALIYGGPALLERAQVELKALLTRDGFTHVSQAVGADSHAGN
jgi:dihydroorotate dehydrogenase